MIEIGENLANLIGGCVLVVAIAAIIIVGLRH